ncbi:molecular chaperone [Enterobacteriaceae bacterium 4M9]|nr:molecular chaperone [Enterobacteriaceae bacterium 4M9]
MMKKRVAIAFLCLLFAAPLHAGIMAAATRVIYPQGHREVSLMLANTNKYPVIVQSWVDNGEGDPESNQAPFVVLPAVFRLSPGERQGLRIIYNQDKLPSDRESVFWLNLYEIPPVTDKQSQQSRLTLAMNTQLKLFWRPKAITATLKDVVSQLTFRLVQDNSGWAIAVNNPTPLNISFTSIALVNDTVEQGTLSQMDMMTRAFSEKRYPLEAANATLKEGKIRYRYLNEDGASIEKTVPLGR